MRNTLAWRMVRVRMVVMSMVDIRGCVLSSGVAGKSVWPAKLAYTACVTPPSANVHFLNVPMRVRECGDSTAKRIVEGEDF